MGMNREFVLSPEDIRNGMVGVWNFVKGIANGGDFLVVVTSLSKSREQEKKYHALIGEFAKQVAFDVTPPSSSKVRRLPQKKQYPPAVWKTLLVDAFEQEKLLMGEPLRKPGRMVMSLDGQRMVSMRPSTRDFTKAEAGEFIEFLYARGIEYGVQWPAEHWQIVEAAKAERGVA